MLLIARPIDFLVHNVLKLIITQIYNNYSIIMHIYNKWQIKAFIHESLCTKTIRI